jgi:MerR family transcriptional regulator, light-induced transcriptional regulator
LRQLTERGHSIGGIARTGLQQLQQMLVQARGAESRTAPPHRLRVHVVGAALAARITSAEWARRMQGTVLDLRSVSVSLDEALARAGEKSTADQSVDVLLVRANGINAGELNKLALLKDASGARHAIVLYNFCAQATLERLRAAGFTVRRQPVDDVELADLIRSVTWARSSERREGEHPGAAIPARRFSDEALAAVAASPPKLLCECPRHLSDIIGQLASFEEYSASCLNDSDEDAHVHAQLRSIAGSARALFEGALDLVLAHEATLRLPATAQALESIP